MPKNFPLLFAIGAFALLFSLLDLHAQKSPFDSGDDEEFFVMLETYAKYGGDIKVIDGLTGGKFSVANEVVIKFHKSLPKIMGGFHQMLLEFERKHIVFRIEDGKALQAEIGGLADKFGIRKFSIDENAFLNREKAIYDRLRTKPFFHLNELVVWDLDKMESRAPENKYAKNIRFDEKTSAWQRRALTRWEVVIPRKNNSIFVVKEQGLNLDTQMGFHEIERGLPGNMHPSYFRDVSLSYPIFVSRNDDTEKQVKHLQQTFVENLRHLYDPFSWVARRSTRFTGGFQRDLQGYVQSARFKVDDRKWFDSLLTHFINDCARVKLHGYGFIYQEYLAQHFGDVYQNQLGKDLDLLNWEPKENRDSRPKGKGHPLKWTRFENVSSARFIMLDAYLRYGDKFVNVLSAELDLLKKKEDPKQVVKRAIATVSGVDADDYIAKAFKEQKALLEKYIAAAPESDSNTLLSKIKAELLAKN